MKAEDFRLFLFSLQQKIIIDEVLEGFFIFFTDFDAVCMFFILLDVRSCVVENQI